MEKIKTLKLHDLPFDYYNSKKQMMSYSVVPFLTVKGLHNVGLFKRLCGCYRNQPFGTITADLMTELSKISQPTPEDIFKVSGLPQEMYPLSEGFPDGTDISAIDTWEKFYKRRGYSFDNPAALLLEVPLTIWHIINKFYLKGKPLSPNGGNQKMLILERKKLTIHLLGVEKEADLAPLFEVLLPFFPKCQLCIHMIGLNVSQTLPQDKRAILLKSMSNDSTIFVTMQPGMYSPQHYNADAFKLPDSFPKELIKDNNFGQGKPDVIIALNGNIMAQQEWAPTVRFLVEQDAELYVTDRMEATLSGLVSSLHLIGSRCVVATQPNPFRQPLLDFKKDVNLPSWSNGYICSLAKQK